MTTTRSVTRYWAMAIGMTALVGWSQAAMAQQDPGPRGGAAGAGGALSGISTSNNAFFTAGQAVFDAPELIADGLGPRFNLDSCSGCHAQPAAGGSSPATNPQVAVATASGARNTVPSFITTNGPIREARFKSDGGVHALFVISGRNDGTSAAACTITQEDFATQLQNNNVIFRIPTPVFGAGLIEAIADPDLVTNLAANATQKAGLGIVGRFNRNGNDGTITRLGWKAQNKSLLLFSAEAYNVEMGISNEMFPDERETNGNCIFAKGPNDITDTGVTTPADAVSDIEKFTFFMRFLAPPTPSANTPGGANSITRGSNLFSSVGCALCHTPSMTTHTMQNAELSKQPVNLFSDLAIHHMGPGLADGIVQGLANGDEFRTAPLWGLGQRIFFLHDGRTNNLLTAIAAHALQRSGWREPGVGGQRGGRQLQRPQRGPETGSAQLPALAVAAAHGRGGQELARSPRGLRRRLV
jgi:CxxC motif-containing protein (DUF1111 family)